jgi:AcrR family transcriptional regulator
VTAASVRAPRRTQAERSGETRRRILDAALTLLGERGYAGLRTGDVAAAAGVSKGAQTHHFPSKDDLVVAVVEHVFVRASEQARQRARRAAASPDEAIKALLADAQEFFFSELFLIALDLAIQGRFDGGDVNSGGSDVTRLSSATRLPVEAHWRAALIESGVPADVADDLLWLSLAIVRGLAVRRLWQHDPPRFKRVLRCWREMAALYLSSLKPPEGRGRARLR